MAGEGSALACPNLDCPPRVRQRLVHWCSPEALAIAGGDEALITQLIKTGLVFEVPEFYKLRLPELATLENLDAAKAKGFIEAVAGSKKQPGWRVLYGLGILQVDAVTAQELARHFVTVDAVVAAGEPQLKAAIRNPDAARSLVRWWAEPWNRRLVARLKKAGLNFQLQ